PNDAGFSATPVSLPNRTLPVGNVRVGHIQWEPAQSDRRTLADFSLLVSISSNRALGQTASLLCGEYFVAHHRVFVRVEGSLGVDRALLAPIASCLDPVTAELHVTPPPPLILAGV
ncbi:MAG TPA: hypothetical protein VK798_07510, partial [Alloacidobacterium sp.]|nr:hypothetical protein [Alloacidobacterium sp.]